MWIKKKKKMKTKTIQAKATILLVDGLPKEARDFKYFNDKENPYMSYKLGVVVEREYTFPQGNWKFISTIENLTEEQADGLVDKGVVMPTAFTEFHHLLLENDVYKINPYVHPDNISIQPASLGWYMDRLAEWQSAEAKVFNPKTTLIFIK